MDTALANVLRDREFSVDPFSHRTAFNRSVYACPSLVKTLGVERTLNSHHGCVNCINFSHEGSLLASGSDDLHIVLWDWMKGCIASKFDSKHIANVFQAKFMPQTNDSVLVSAARDGQVRRHVISTTGQVMASEKVAYHNDSAHKLATEPDNPHVFLSCGEDGSVLEVDLRMETPQRNKILVCKNTKNSKLSLYSIFIDPSNYNKFAISGRDQFARIYDRRLLAGHRGNEGESSNDKDTNSEPIQTFCPSHLASQKSDFMKANITCLVYSHDGKELLCSYNDEDIYTFDTTTANCTIEDYVGKFAGHRNNATVKGVNYFGLQSEYIISGSDCGHVFLWDKKTSDIVQLFEGDKEGVVNCLEPHPHIPVLAVSGLDHSVKICTPSVGTPPDLNQLEEVTSRNMEERNQSNSQPNGYDFLLDFIMRQYRRRMRHRIHEEGRNDSSTSDSSDEEEVEEEEEGDGEGETVRPRRRIIWRYSRGNREEEGDSSDEGEGEGGGEGGEAEGGRGRVRRIVWRYPRGNREEGEGEGEEEEDENDDQDQISCTQS